MVVADGEVEDENKQVSLKEARKIEPDYEVGAFSLHLGILFAGQISNPRDLKGILETGSK